MHHRNLIWPAAAMVAIMLTGCTWANTDQLTPPTVAVEQIAVPESMMPTEPSVRIDQVVLPATNTLPWLVGGSIADPGEAARPTVWTSADGVSWTAQPVDPTFSGHFIGDLAGSSELTALAGIRWNAGTPASVVWTSTDRKTWRQVQLPDDFARTYRTTDVTVSGSTVVIIGRDPEGAYRGIWITDDRTTQFELPDVGDDDLVASSLIARDRELLLIASPGPEGEPSPTVAFTSRDLGESWGTPAPITDALGSVTGVSVAEDGFVATGGVPSEGDATVAASWFSADGSAWVAESVPAPPEESPLAYVGSADALLGAPLTTGILTIAIMANENSAVSGFYARTTGGRWTFVGESTANPDSGVGGVAISLGGFEVAGFIGEGDYLRAGVLSADWSDTTMFAERDDIAIANTVAKVGDRVLMTLTTPTFSVTPDLGWRNSQTSDLGELTGSELKTVAWEPAHAADLLNVKFATDAAGSEMIVGSSFPVGSNAVRAESYVKSSASSTWVAGAGFDATGATALTEVKNIGDSWIAVGNERAAAVAGQPRNGVVWTSVDGVAWAKTAGDFGGGSLESSVSDVCELPDGTPVAVGWTEESAGSYRVSVWKLSDGRWLLTDTGAIGSASGTASSCASSQDGVVMSAAVAGRPTLQFSANGANWEEVFRAERGMNVGEPVKVSGGFAAAGSMLSEAYSGPVVWVSADGEHWSALAVPSVTPGSTLDVAPYGDDLVITMDGQVGHPVSLIRDIAKVIAGT